MTTTTTTAGSRPRRTGHRLLLGVSGALSVLATLIVVVTVTWPFRPPDPGHTTAATSPDPVVAARLRNLADHITSVPADYHSGPYTYTHSQGWYGVDLPPEDARIGRVDVQQWQHVNGSERFEARRLPAWPGLDHLPDGTDRPQFANAAVETGDFTAAELPPRRVTFTPEQIATDPDRLRAQLRQLHPSWSDTDMLLSNIIELGDLAYLGRAQRATVLRLLAGIAGLRYDGQSTDLAGRTGAAFRYTDPVQNATTWLTINPVSGELMAYRRVYNRRHATVFCRYDLLLEHDRREHP